jgi:FkbM family methyltransferase
VRAARSAGATLLRLRRLAGAAGCVRETARFTVAELTGRPPAASYRLRRSGLRVRIRHPLLDAWVLEEIFRFGAYRPPHAALEALAVAGQAPRVLDLGGHAGMFGLWARERWPRAVVRSYEPDPGNAATLRACIEANALGELWQLVEAAAGAQPGEVVLHSSFHLSRVAEADDTSLQEFQSGISAALPFLAGRELVRSHRITVPRHDVLPELARADLVKLDIEGGEWGILADPRFPRTGARALVMEYHPRYAPAGDADALVLALLERAGFRAEVVSRDADGATLWAWRPPGRSS